MQSSALCSTKHNKKHDCCLKQLPLEGLYRFSWVFSIIVDLHDEVQGNDVFQSAARKQIKMHLWLMWIVGTTSQSVCQSVFRATLGSCKAHPAPASQSLNVSKLSSTRGHAKILRIPWMGNGGYQMLRIRMSIPQRFELQSTANGVRPNNTTSNENLL